LGTGHTVGHSGSELSAGIIRSSPYRFFPSVSQSGPASRAPPELHTNLATKPAEAEGGIDNISHQNKEPNNDQDFRSLRHGGKIIPEENAKPGFGYSAF
jgi:hypothetical protein